MTKPHQKELDWRSSNKAFLAGLETARRSTLEARKYLKKMKMVKRMEIR